MTAPQQLTEALMQTLGFTLDELVLNRSGNLSQRQRLWLKRMGGRGDELMNLSLGLLVVGGGTTAPYVFVEWNPLLGAVLGVVVMLSVPLLMVRISLSRMDEALRRQWGTMAIISNAVLGFLFAIGWMGVVFKIYDSSDTAGTAVRLLLIVGLASLLVGPLIYWFQRAHDREVRVIEGIVKIEAEGFGPERRAWNNEIGIIANLSILAALVARNLAQGRGIGRRPEDFKIVTSHSVTVGKRKFYTTTEIGTSFVEGARYRVYYASAYPLPLLVSGEALEESRFQ